MAVVTILGKLGKDVELKDINGKRLASFSIADTVGWGDNKQIGIRLIFGMGWQKLTLLII